MAHAARREMGTSQDPVSTGQTRVRVGGLRRMTAMIRYIPLLTIVVSRMLLFEETAPNRILGQEEGCDAIRLR
jgi:hypothetical protein